MLEAEKRGPAGTSEAASVAELHTFLIVDVRGYTRFTQERGDEAAARFATTFADLVEEKVALRHGRVVELRGDEALAVFRSARQALRAAVELQGRFAEEMGRDPSLPFKVGIGLDAGEAVPVKGGYRGGALNLAARLCSLAGPGEVLATETLINLARRTEGLEYAERGTVQLKGLNEPVKIVQVMARPEHLPQAAIDRVAGEATASTQAEQRLPIGGFLGSLPSGTLVARDEEMSRLLAAAEAVSAGEGRLVLLAGEPGAGKTRLAQELMLNARNRDFLVAAGSCYEPRQAVPYYPFLDTLVMLYRVAPPAIRLTVPQRWPYLGRLLPESGIPIRGPGTEDQEEQERLFRTVTGFIQTLAETAPVALLLDDLQWADGSSLGLLQHLARHTRAHRVLLVGTYRSVEVGWQHPLGRVLTQLNREQLMERIGVQRMGPEGTEALVRASFGQIEVSQEFVELVHRYTEGNPFFTQEVLRALTERGDIYWDGERWRRRQIEQIDVPESVRAAIGERISRLSEGTQELLHEASVLGQTFAFDHLQAVGGRSEEDVERAVEEAGAADLIREMDRDQYGFNHVLTQQALYEELPGRRRRRLHLAAGEALEALTQDERQPVDGDVRGGRTQRVPGGWPARRFQAAADLASHFLEADEAERALPYELLAGDQAGALFAHAEAERHYRTALQLVSGISAGAGRHGQAEAHFKLGRTLFVTANYEEALPLLDRAVQLYEALGDPVLQGWAAVLIARIYGSQGRTEEQMEALSRVERLLERIDTTIARHDLARLYLDLEFLYFRVGRYSRWLATLEQAARLAQALGDDHLLTLAEVRRAMALGYLGRLRDAASLAESLVPRAEAAGEQYALLRALDSAAELSMLTGEFERSWAYRQRELVLSERMGATIDVASTLYSLTQLALYRGEWQQARVYGEQALEMLRSLGNVYHSVFATLLLGELAVREGDWEAASRYLEECVVVAERFGDLFALRFGHRLLAERDLLAGNPEAARERLQPLLDRPALQETDVTFLLPTLARAHLEAGDQERAEQVAMEALDRARPQHHRLALVDALRVHGMVHRSAGRWQEAQRAFEEATDLVRPMPYPYAEARALYEWGLMHLQKRERKQARERLEQALTIFRRLGARPYAERTEQALAGLQ